MIVIVSKKRFNDLNKVVLSAGKYIKALQDENVALRQAIEQAAQPKAEQEPVAYVHGDDLDNMLGDRLAFIQRDKSGHRATALYTSPQPQKPCDLLTDEMIAAGGKALAKLHADSCELDFEYVWKRCSEDYKADAKAVIEAAHNIHL